MLFLEKLEQKRMYLIAVLVICILVGVAYGLGFAEKEKVSATSVMLIKRDVNQDSSGLNNGTLELSKSLVSTYEELIKSDSNLNEIKFQLNMPSTNNELKKQIDVEKVANSDTFKILVRNVDEEIALEVSKEIINNFSEDLYNVNSFIKLYIIDNPHIIGTTYTSVVARYALQGFVIALIIDWLYIMLLVALEKNSKTGLTLETQVSLKTLMTIPYKDTKKKKEQKVELIAYENEKTDLSKAFKSLRSNIQFVNVNNENKNIILVTSPNKNDGKTFVAANLAISYAETGKKVVLIDADMKTGRLGKLFNIPNNLGLSNFLSNLDTNGLEINELVSKFINETAIKNLNLITSGTVPPNSNELLTSNKLVNMIKDLSVFYDVVIIDSTPILTTTDSLILTRVASSTLVVVNYKNTKTDDLIRAKKDIQNVGGRIIGVVINNVKHIKYNVAKTEIKENLGKIKSKFKDRLDKIKKYIKDKTYEQKLLNEKNEIQEVKEEPEDTYIEKIEKLDDKIDEKIEEIEDRVEGTIETIQGRIKGFFGKVVNNIKNKEEFVKEENLQEIKEDAQIEIKNEEVANEIKEEIQDEIVEEKVPFDISEFANRYKEKAFQFVNSGKDSAIEKIDRTKAFFENRFKQISNKEEIENIENIESIPEVQEPVQQEMIQEEMVEDIDTRKSKKKKASRNEETEVLVIVDSENGFCRVFSKHCFTEKLVRGVDKTDGIYKGNYSVSLIKAKTNYIMENYDLTAKQVKNIDPLVFSTLQDYDECMWLEKKMTSNKAEIYVRCMSEKIEKQHGESHKEYLLRCQLMRQAALNDAEIEIEYKVDDIYSSRKMNFTDKMIMKKYADIYWDKNLKEDVERKQNGEKLSFIDNAKDFVHDKVSGIKEVFGNLKVEQVKAKTIEELENEVEQESNREIEGQYDLTDSEYSQEIIKDEEFSKNLRAEYERQKEERRKELEVLKKIKKEKKEFKKREKIEQRKIKLEAKRFKKEELRKNKIIEREKQKVEARIEEELMDDNLYPKTKNNKNI